MKQFIPIGMELPWRASREACHATLALIEIEAPNWASRFLFYGG
jgi:hypothetical protein